jgi:hypothetical protein
MWPGRQSRTAVVGLAYPPSRHTVRSGKGTSFLKRRRLVPSYGAAIGSVRGFRGDAAQTTGLPPWHQKQMVPEGDEPAAILVSNLSNPRAVPSTPVINWFGVLRGMN